MREIFISNRTKAVLLSLIVVLVCSSGMATLALLIDTTEELTNTFDIGNVTTEIEEEFEKVTNTTFKKEPSVKNTGENDCYVRIRVTASPADALEILNWNLGTGEGQWTAGDRGYFYYNSVLKTGETTLTPLFEGVEVIDTTIDGFEVTVYQEAVQAKMNAADGTSTTDMMTIWAAYEANVIPETFNTVGE